MDHSAQILFQLFAVLLAAKLGDEVFKRIGQPTVIGEILGGVIVGPAALGIYQVNAETTLFAEIGVVLLLFRVGLETRLHDLLRVGGSASRSRWPSSWPPRLSPLRSASRHESSLTLAGCAR